MINEGQTLAFLAAMLMSRGWPKGQPPAPPEGSELLFETARRAGVAVALFDTVRWQETDSPAASVLRTALASEARRAAVYEILNRAELMRVLPRLISAGRRFLLFKGAPLSHTLYPNPAQRTRCDTDVLVPLDEYPDFVETLHELGYREQTSISGEIVSHQKSFVYMDSSATTHVFDVHWKISNRPGLADRIGFEELWKNSRDVPVLGAGLRAPDDVHALLLACVHLAGHHPGEERLIWLYDIHLLTRSLSAAEKSRFTDLCRDKDVVRYCLPVLALARRYFPSPALTRLIPALGGAEARCITGVRPSRLKMLAEDLRALPDWSTRLHLLKEHAIPNADYMQKRFGVRSRYLLSYYYAKRIASGVGGWLRRL